MEGNNKEINLQCVLALEKIHRVVILESPSFQFWYLHELSYNCFKNVVN